MKRARFASVLLQILRDPVQPHEHRRNPSRAELDASRRAAWESARRRRRAASWKGRFPAPDAARRRPWCEGSRRRPSSPWSAPGRCWSTPWRAAAASRRHARRREYPTRPAAPRTDRNRRGREICRRTGDAEPRSPSRPLLSAKSSSSIASRARPAARSPRPSGGRRARRNPPCDDCARGPRHSAAWAQSSSSAKTASPTLWVANTSCFLKPSISTACRALADRRRRPAPGSPSSVQSGWSPIPSSSATCSSL